MYWTGPILIEFARDSSSLLSYNRVKAPIRKPSGGGRNMQWTKPAYTEIRYGFEITMYIMNR
jgi:coenzyme PQQ precursor peptide PqqA